MAITDLTGTKWEFESTLTDNVSLDVSINYTSNDTSFDRLFIVFVPAANMARIIYAAGQTQTDAYNNGWLSEAFKTIEITGGTGVTNASLIAFIEAHATQVVDPTDVMISYGGSYIATMSNSGTEVLETAGTYLTDDITIDYTKSGGTPTLQSKTVTPSGSTLIVSPDTGYDGLSSVTVNPITLKMGVELPAAELVRSFTYDKKVVTDLSVNIPSYSTSAQTLVSSSALTPTVTLSLNSYAYYVLARFLTIPVYNTATIAKGRNEYLYSSCAYEIVSIPANTFKAASGKLYASRNTTTLPVGVLNKLFYWSSTSAVTVYNTATYGCYQTPTAPSVSSASSATPTLTISAPAIGMRGHNTYLPSGVWSTITDIRCQYVIEVYRVPLSTYNYNGWGIYQQAEQIMDCADLSTRKLS